MSTLNTMWHLNRKCRHFKNMITHPVSANLVREVPVHLIDKDTWPGNKPDLNPKENMFSILDNIIYRDPEPQTMVAFEKNERLLGTNIC